MRRSTVDASHGMPARTINGTVLALQLASRPVSQRNSTLRSTGLGHGQEQRPRRRARRAGARPARRKWNVVVDGDVPVPLKRVY